MCFFNLNGQRRMGGFHTDQVQSVMKDTISCTFFFFYSLTHRLLETFKGISWSTVLLLLLLLYPSMFSFLYCFFLIFFIILLYFFSFIRKREQNTLMFKVSCLTIFCEYCYPCVNYYTRQLLKVL